MARVGHYGGVGSGDFTIGFTMGKKSLEEVVGLKGSGGESARLVGREKWRVYAPLIVIGMFIGDGIIFMIDSAILLAIKSQWLLPY